MKFAQTIATASLQQLAMAEFLAGGHYERHLRSLRKSVAATMLNSRLLDSMRPDGNSTFWRRNASSTSCTVNR